MAPDPRCTALSNVMKKQGTYRFIILLWKEGIDNLIMTFLVSVVGVTYAQIATKIGSSEQHVIDGIFSEHSPPFNCSPLV